ncbi:MAG: methyltransferase, TIGR04325 family [Saccharospirillum sp.]|uniref:methyltransferase, TIGR04325 family n=1 Tax=Saccharospirillum sp. TaxID=2033801 RepID=UPI0032987055
MYKSVKSRIINGIELLPFGHDIYLQLAKKRLGITYRGVFDTSRAAQHSAFGEVTSEYDVINEEKNENLDNEMPILDKRVLDIDYPLLFWLSRLMKPSQKILELGGSIGQGFYSFERYFPYPDNIIWVIAELAGAVKAGQKVAEMKQEERLDFIESNCLSDVHSADIFMTAGTIQYIDTNLSTLLNDLRQLPEHVLIHNLPAHPTEDFWTLQNLTVCEVPYHIHSLANLVSDMESSGFELIDQWKHPRQIEIPYNLNKKVEHYFGFYFKRRLSAHPKVQN